MRTETRTVRVRLYNKFFNKFVNLSKISLIWHRDRRLGSGIHWSVLWLQLVFSERPSTPRTRFRTGTSEDEDVHYEVRDGDEDVRGPQFSRNFGRGRPRRGPEQGRGRGRPRTRTAKTRTETRTWTRTARTSTSCGGLCQSMILLKLFWQTIESRGNFLYSLLPWLLRIHNRQLPWNFPFPQ